MRGLFEGRADAYLQERAGGKAVCIREPLTDRVWLDHLLGRKRIGSYGLQHEGDETLVADGITLDLDGKNASRFPGGPSQALEVARELLALAEDIGLPAYLYLSRSQRGYHVRMFGRVPRQTAQRVGRCLAAAVLRQQGLVSDAIEVFPKGSPDRDFGGAVFAEYFGLLSDGGGSNLMIDTTGKPLPDQISLMQEIQTVSPDRVSAALARLTDSEGATTSAAQETSGAAPQVGEDWVAVALRGVEKGDRNDTCARLAGHLVFKGISEEACVEILRAWNSRNTEPLEEAELLATMRGVYHRYARPQALDPFEHALDLTTLSEADEQIPWLVDRLAARGDLTLVSGLPDSGKSVLSCHLAYCLAAGKPVLGQFEVPSPVSVAVISADNPVRVDKLRLRRMGTGLRITPEDVRGRLHWFSRRDLVFDPATVQHLRGFLDRHRPDVLIIDTLGAVFPHDVSDGEAIRNFIRTAIRPLIDAFDLAVFIVHHRRKEGGRGTPNDPGNSILGSVTLWACVDNHWSLKARGNDQFSFVHHKCRWPERVPSFVFRTRDVEEGTGVIVEYAESLVEQKARATRKKSDGKEALATALVQAPDGRLSPREARKKLHGQFSEPAVNRAAAELEADGRLRRVPPSPKRCQWWELAREEQQGGLGGEADAPLPGCEPPGIGSDHSDL